MAATLIHPSTGQPASCGGLYGCSNDSPRQSHKPVRHGEHPLVVARRAGPVRSRPVIFTEGCLRVPLSLVLLCQVWLAPDGALADAAACADFGPVDVRIEEGIPVEVQRGEVVASENGLPAYCAVRGVVAPQVGFEVRLPLEGWNGRFLQQGCSGMCGTIKLQAADDALARGYAVASTDMGHQASSSRSGLWAYENPSARRDFWYRGTHVTAVAAKYLVQQYYGEPPTRSFHRGCGTGGRAGLIEAQRFPGDFDGILVTGGSVLNFVRNNLAILWNIRTSQDTNGDPLLKPADLDLLHDAVVAACATDGTGVIANPLDCKFDPATLMCGAERPEQDGQCLTPQQAAAVASLYAGPRNARGEQIYSGQARGSELAWSRTFFGPSFMEAFATQMFSYLILPEPPGPDFNVGQIDFDLPLATYAEVNALGASDRVDYQGFKARGGKLLMAYGWHESSMPGTHAADYFDRVAQANGGLQATQEFFRLFMVPGNFACVGGSPRGRQIDFLTAMEAWVEEGAAPERLLATSPSSESGMPVTTRPLFPYPSHGAYSGRGDPGRADSYVESRSR
jgi:hypothetical protein